MPKQIILFCLIIASSLPLLSQKKSKDTLFEIDFKYLKKEYKYHVEYKSSSVIRIININRKVYEVEEEKVEKDFNTEVPSAFTKIQLPGFINLGRLPQLDQAIATMKDLPDEFSKDTAKAIETSLEEIKRRAKKLDHAVFYYHTLDELSKNCHLEAKEIKDSLFRLTGKYLYGTIPNHPYDVIVQEKEFSDTLYDMRIGAERNLSEIRKKLKSVKDLLTNKISEFKNQILEERKIVDSVSTTRAQKEKAKVEINNYEKMIKERSNDLKTFSKIETSLAPFIKEAEDAIASMYEFEKENNIRTIINAYSLLMHPNSFTYSAKLKEAKKDKVKYTFTVTPKELNECTTEDKKPIEVELLTNGGWKIDFSTGIFINKGDEDFLGRTYYYKKYGDTAREIISAERGRRLMLSLGALMHIYLRRTSCVKFAGSLGVSTTADFTDLNFHAGPSLIIGNENRFIITAGLTLKSSPQLDRQLKMDKIYSVEESPDEIPTVNVFPRAGCFISLTYNVSRFGKE